VLATGPTGLCVAGTGPAEDGGFLWVVKIRLAHFLLTRDSPASLPDGSGC
jgi:hypothetical protein